MRLKLIPEVGIDRGMKMSQCRYDGNALYALHERFLQQNTSGVEQNLTWEGGAGLG